MPRTPIDYAKTIIYKLVHKDDPDNHETYVGHTTDFRDRKSSHKRRCEDPDNSKHHLKVYQYIRENGGWDNFIMLEIEKYPCNDNNEARAREQEWYNQLKSKLNKICPKRSYKEWYDVNREMVQERNKEWLNKDDNRNKMLKYYNDRYYEKKDEILAKQKAKYEANKDAINEKRRNAPKPKINCDHCGMLISKMNISTHKKTQKCINFKPA
jgi:hypothetical protein